MDFWIRSGLLFLIPNYALSTRFLPMVVWDHLNPQLSCKCNWPVIPHTDVYDRLEFVCPTLKIAVKLLDGFTRDEQKMNENIFRRPWHGTKRELRESIRNNRIHSFCNVTSPETTRVHTCKNGLYDSKAVTLKRDSDESRNYKKGHIYVFFNNGNDGREETLKSERAHCHMMFAIYVSEEEEVDHDITFGKTALSGSCNCKPSSSKVTTTTPQPSKTLPAKLPDQFISTQSSLVRVNLTLTTSPSTATPTAAPSNSASPSAPPLSSVPSTIQPSTTKEPKATSCKFPAKYPAAECEHGWLTTTIFVVAVVVTFVLGVLCTLIYFTCRKKSKRKAGFTNVTYSSSPKSDSVDIDWISRGEHV